MDRLALGNAAERIAREFLAARGLTLVCSNYRCRLGELDLVCLDGNVLVVAEVRLRSTRRFGGASESIDWAKRRRIVRATQHLLMRHRELRCHPVRFDVVAFDETAPTTGAVQWIKGAFE